MVGSAMFVVVACCVMYLFIFGFRFCNNQKMSVQPRRAPGQGHGMAWISTVLNVIECETQSYP